MSLRFFLHDPICPYTIPETWCIERIGRVLPPSSFLLWLRTGLLGVYGGAYTHILRFHFDGFLPNTVVSRTSWQVPGLRQWLA